MTRRYLYIDKIHKKEKKNEIHSSDIVNFVSGLDCKVPGDVVFLLDGSQSINEINWRRQKNFVANLINNLEVTFQSLYEFSTIQNSTFNRKSDIDRHN